MPFSPIKLKAINKMNSALKDVIQAPQPNTDGWKNNWIYQHLEII